MILQAGKHAETAVLGNTDEAIDMSIDAADQHVLMQILSEGLYKDPIGSTIREWASNALDSHTEAKVKEPIVVQVYQDASYSWFFRVTDYGMGISPDRLQKVISKYASSTKRKDATMLGAFGLGLKSGLAYSDSFTFTTRWEGTETEYIMYKGEEGTKIDTLDSKPTEERNGTSFQIQIKNSTDRQEFINKCRQQLCYFKDVFFEVNGIPNDFKITQTEDWKFSELNGDKRLHLCLEDVYYSIDFNRLGIREIDVPIGLNFKISDGLIPIPSREDIKYTPQIKELILDKIKRVADYFTEKYNNSVTESSSIFEVKDKFGIKMAEITEKRGFSLNEFKLYSSIPIKEPTVKGITKLNLAKVIANQNELLEEYSLRGRIINGAFTGKYEDQIRNPFMHFGKLVLVQERPKGVALEYLKETVGDCRFVYKTSNRKLGKANMTARWSGGIMTYRELLGIQDHPKEDWRQIIEEYKKLEKQLTDALFIDIKTLAPTQKWLDERKANRVISAKKAVAKVEVNPRWATPAQRWGTLATFEADKVMQLVELGRMEKLYVYGSLEDKEMLGHIFYLRRGERIQTAMLTARDIEKVKTANFHNWITIEEFMKGNNAPFKTCVTSIRIQDLVQKHRLVFGSIDFIAKLSTEFASKLKMLQLFAKTNNCTVYGDQFKNSIMKLAEDNDLWDASVISELKEVEHHLANTFNFFDVINTGTREMDEKRVEAVRDILKYRKFKLNLEHYAPKELPKEEVAASTEIDENIEIEEYI